MNIYFFSLFFQTPFHFFIVKKKIDKLNSVHKLCVLQKKIPNALCSHATRVRQALFLSR